MEKEITDKFYSWRKQQYKDKTGFFPIFSGFSKKMLNLSTGAISLYVFLGLKSNYNTGTSFYSINKLSILFDKSPRTISLWLKDLEDNNLIYRKQTRKNGVSITYLLPYNNV